MINSLDFPDGIKWKLNYITGGDFIGDGISLTSCTKLYYGARNSVVDVKFDTSNTTDMQGMFSGCSNLLTILQLNTSNVTNMDSMFHNCSVLISIPQLDTSKVTNMQSMFNYCQKLTSIPQLDMSNVTNLNQMFNYCQKLTSIPDCNCVKVLNFGSSSSIYSWVYNCNTIQSIGVIDCDSVTNIGYALGTANQIYLTHLGGFRNLGKAKTVSNTNSNYFLNYAPNLTYESVINVLNGLYDRASAGLSVLTLKLHANHLAMLSDDDIAIATNKGWTIV